MKDNPVIESEKIDFVADVHGRYDLLIELLDKLGYIKDQYEDEIYYKHPDDRKLIFVGDIVDRGSKPLECIKLIAPMIKYGIAECLLGNHEYNYLAYNTKFNKSGDFLREHNKDNTNQVKVTLARISDSIYYDWIQGWMKHLIFYVRTLRFNVVHAHWNQEYISLLEESGDTLFDLGNYFFTSSNMKGTKEFEIIEDILKSPELQLPPGDFVLDSENRKRYKKRIEWWEDEKHDIPIFFGHYSLESEPHLLSDKICCLDFGKFNKGKYLTVYRWDGEEILKNEKLVWVK